MSEHTLKFVQNPGISAMSLSQTMGVFCARINNLCETHWDLNALWQLRKDAHDGLALFDASEHIELQSISDILNACLENIQLPDENQVKLLQVLSEEMQIHGIASIHESTPIITNPMSNLTNKRIETPPKAFWLRYTKLNAPPTSLIKTSMENSMMMDTNMISTINMNNQTTARKPYADGVVRQDSNAINFRIYHLSDYSKVSIELDLQIEHAGMDVEILNSMDELIELLQALPADLLLIDPSFLEPIETISSRIKQVQNNSLKPLPIIQLTDVNSSPESIDIATTTYNACASTLNGAEAIVAQIEQLLRFGKQEQYRVLIVEDDRSQAMFAEGILRNAEIITRVLLNSEALLQTIEEFLPDLILMDLYMPNANGIELTELIRKSNHFQNTPIVFLSGEIDEDKQVDALEAGGDDFLLKPIRPRRLIAAVQNRIKRHRNLQLIAQQQPTTPEPEHLIQRADMLELLKLEIKSTQKALFYIELSSYNILEGKLGLSALEKLLKELSGLLIKASSPNPVARFGDSSFMMVYEGNCSTESLFDYASNFKAQIKSHTFMAMNQVVDVRIHIGICQFESAEGDPDLLVDAAIRTAQAARKISTGIEIFKPKSSSAKEREERLISLMRNAEHNHCLSHIYQPIVAVGGSEEKQFQCLLRLKDSTGETVSAAEFIPLASKNNLLLSIDRWSLTNATRVIAAHVEKQEEVKFFVNQSSSTLLTNGQVDWLKQLLHSKNIPANSLVIEINYEDMLHNQTAIQASCQLLNSEHIQFCLSRFNPKNDEPDVLENLPISYLKLDHKLNSELASQSIRDEVKMIVDTAHKRGIEVIGHSVEDAQTAATLWMNGIDFIQGNLIQHANETLDFEFDQAVL